MIKFRRAELPACCAPSVGPPPILLLASEPQSASAARKFVREFVTYHVPDASDNYVDASVLVACELVTNALRYGTEPGDTVRVVLDSDTTRTRIEVHDPVRRHPKVRPESAERDRRRGLIILDFLCPDAWGVDDIPMGKTVWAEVSAR
ncbi:ATP-binding protein [Streptomyces sp. NPDC007094]|uniref:ATP-binding protein n=1 Tax=Streptomyces sp. NPDC007094 TaxID=3155359 RepID=UPI0033DD0F82